MSSFPESSLITAGFLRQRCREAINLECPACGTALHGLSMADCVNGVECGTCGQWSSKPRVKCTRCKELLPSLLLDAERDCRSVEAYRKADCAPAFAPDEALWAFKRSARGHEEVVSESDLRRCFSSGELDATVLVHSASDDNFLRGDACPAFRDVARPRPTPVTTAQTPKPIPIPSLPSEPSGSTSPPTSSVAPLRSRPGLVSILSFAATVLTGFILSAVAFLGTQVDNMAATFLSAASISFVLYCLSHSIRGSNRLFGRLAIIGGILWLTTGAPLISIVTDPEEGSRVLIRVFPFSWIAQISEDNRKALLGLSVLIVPFIAGIIGNYIVRLGAISPRLTARLLLPLYVVFIVLLITCPHWLRSQL